MEEPYAERKDRRVEKSESQVRGGRERTPAQKWSLAFLFHGAAEASCRVPEEPVHVCNKRPTVEHG